MNNQRIEQFIHNNELVAIGYLTDKDPETVHPWVKRIDGQSYVYGRTGDDQKLRNIEISEFLRLAAKNTKGLAVGGKRKGGKGKQTSISFSKTDRLTIDPALQQLLESIG